MMTSDEHPGAEQQAELAFLRQAFGKLEQELREMEQHQEEQFQKLLEQVDYTTAIAAYVANGGPPVPYHLDN